MSSVTMVEMVVEELSKFGFKANGRYVNYSKKFEEADKAKVVPGAAFDAEVFVADSGKEYLNKIIKMLNTKTTVEVPVVVDTERAIRNTPKEAFKPKYAKKDTPSASMSKEEWQAKDRSQLIGGLSHDAAAVVATLGFTTVSDTLEAYKEALQGMLKIREELK